MDNQPQVTLLLLNPSSILIPSLPFVKCHSRNMLHHHCHHELHYIQDNLKESKYCKTNMEHSLVWFNCERAFFWERQKGRGFVRGGEISARRHFMGTSNPNKVGFKSFWVFSTFNYCTIHTMKSMGHGSINGIMPSSCATSLWTLLMV